MRFVTNEIAAAVGGTAHFSAVTVEGVATDSRKVAPGNLFVPVRAARDGHEFIAEALRRGAAAYLTERDDDLGDEGSPAIRVADTVGALRDLAIFARGRLRATTVGITGSVGKTTTKDLTSGVLSTTLVTHASERSFNNYLGVPLTVLNAPADCDALVLEIGTNAPGEIAALCRVARPDVGVVTRVAVAHTAGFGDELGVAEEKADLVRALPAGGLAVLNADDPLVANMATQTCCPCLMFGETDGDVRLRILSVDPELRAHIRADTPWGVVETVLAARGRHQVTNAGAAIAVGGHLGVPVDAIASGLAHARLSGSRMALRRANRGFKLIDDSYNANPESMRAALEALAALPAIRRVAVVGQMTELGAISTQQHEYVAAEAKRLGIELLAVEAPEYGVHNLDDVLAAAKWLWLADLGEDDAVLVKASHVSGLERLVGLLCDPDRP